VLHYVGIELYHVISVMELCSGVRGSATAKNISTK
jgi:hypothetical protein